MNNVIYSDYFETRLKRFVKKFPSLLDEIEELATLLEENAQIGISLGAGIFKIRLSSKSKGSGKSGGFRVITFVVYQESKDSEVYLLTLFDKSEESNIKKEDLLKLAARIIGK